LDSESSHLVFDIIIRKKCDFSSSNQNNLGGAGMGGLVVPGALSGIRGNRRSHLVCHPWTGYMSYTLVTVCNT